MNHKEWWARQRKIQFHSVLDFGVPYGLLPVGTMVSRSSPDGEWPQRSRNKSGNASALLELRGAPQIAGRAGFYSLLEAAARRFDRTQSDFHLGCAVSGRGQAASARDEINAVAD